MTGTHDSEAARTVRDDEVTRSRRLRRTVVAFGALGSLGLAGVAAVTTAAERADATGMHDRAGVSEPGFLQPQQPPTVGNGGVPNAQSSGS